jgi:cytoskeletal protein RodZ
MARDPLNRRDRLRLVEPPRLVLHDPTEDLPADPNYNGVGAALRAVRRQAGFGLDEVAARLRIRRDYLRAVEAGQFASLPGASYAQGYVRSYADFLGLDAAQVLEAYRQEDDAANADRPLNFPVPAADQRTPRIWLLLLAAVLCLGVYLAWAVYQERQYLASRELPPVPDSILSAAPPPAPTPLPAPLPAPLATAPAPVPPAPALSTAVPVRPLILPPPAAEDPAPPAAPALAAPLLVTPAPPPSLAPAPPPALAVAVPPPPPLPGAPPAAVPAPPRPAGIFGSEAPDARILVRASQRAWIRVATGQGQTLFQRILEPGEVYRVPDQPDLIMDAGNLGGLEITVDGKTVPPLGATGIPRKNISLVPATLLERAAAAN